MNSVNGFAILIPSSLVSLGGTIFRAMSWRREYGDDNGLPRQIRYIFLREGINHTLRHCTLCAGMEYLILAKGKAPGPIGSFSTTLYRSVQMIYDFLKLIMHWDLEVIQRLGEPTD